MRRRFRILIVLASTFAMVLVLSVGIAGADPKNAFGPVHLDCDSGLSFDITTLGNGDFMAAHIVGSTAKFIPVEFIDFNVFVVVEGVGIVDTIRDSEDLMQGGGKTNPSPPGGIDRCDFDFNVPAGPGVSIVGDGEVRGFVTPPRP